MKIDGHGKAKVLTNDEIDRIFNSELISIRDKAIFAICLYTACRINECVTLRKEDVYYKKGVVRPEIVIRKGNTKGKLATRCIPVIEDLRCILKDYYPEGRSWYCFPGDGIIGHIHSDSASRILRRTCRKLEIQGVSTHSFRRTALTLMSNRGIPLRIIQEVSGHRSLAELQKYLEVTPEQVLGAVSSLSLLTPPVAKSTLHDPETMKSNNSKKKSTKKSKRK